MKGDRIILRCLEKFPPLRGSIGKNDMMLLDEKEKELEFQRQWREFAMKNTVEVRNHQSDPAKEFVDWWRMQANRQFDHMSSEIKITAKNLGTEFEVPRNIHWGAPWMTLCQYKFSTLDQLNQRTPCIALMDCNVRSFEGIEKTYVRRLRLYNCNQNEHKPGVLRFLKSPILEEVMFFSSFSKEDGIGRHNEMAVIINKHLSLPALERSKVDLQTELIDAGFEDFAKL